MKKIDFLTMISFALILSLSFLTLKENQAVGQISLSVNKNFSGIWKGQISSCSLADFGTNPTSNECIICPQVQIVCPPGFTLVPQTCSQCQHCEKCNGFKEITLDLCVINGVIFGTVSESGIVKVRIISQTVISSNEVILSLQGRTETLRLKLINNRFLQGVFDNGLTVRAFLAKKISLVGNCERFCCKGFIPLPVSGICPQGFIPSLCQLPNPNRLIKVCCPTSSSTSSSTSSTSSTTSGSSSTTTSSTSSTTSSTTSSSTTSSSSGSCANPCGPICCSSEENCTVSDPCMDNPSCLAPISFTCTSSSGCLPPECAAPPPGCTYVQENSFRTAPFACPTCGKLVCSTSSSSSSGCICPTSSSSSSSSGSCDPIGSCRGPNGAIIPCPEGTVCSAHPVYKCYPDGCPYPICCSPDTNIRTPEIQRRIADIKAGDWVLTDNEKVVRVAKVSKTEVKNHKIMKVTLNDGIILEVSPGHSTADGRLFKDLKIGDKLDGHLVTETKLIPYTYKYTYDILPDSPTGNYYANGVLIGSTLKKH